VLRAEKSQPTLPGFTAEPCALFMFSLAAEQLSQLMLCGQGLQTLRSQRVAAQVERPPQIPFSLTQQPQLFVSAAEVQAQGRFQFRLLGDLSVVIQVAR